MNGARLTFDIQLFAKDPDKTEQATPRRREKAREDGQVPYSKDLAMALVFISVIVVLRFMIPLVYHGMRKIMTFFVALPNRGTFQDFRALGQYISLRGDDLAWALIMIILSGVVIAITTGFAQTKGFLSLKKAFKFDLNKINPIEGFKKLFSLRSVVELIKNLLKLAVLGVIAFLFIRDIWSMLFLLPNQSLLEGMIFLADSLYTMTLRIAFALLAIGFVDFFYQRWEFERDIMMSKKEVKDERKDVEGNPEIKKKQRQKMQEMAQRRMMEEVPSATVVVTNPTHLSIAIKFNIETMNAPVVVALGADNIAMRIREIAKEYDVPIYEDKTLARELYERVDIGDEIPNDMYRAVAEVLAYVFQTSGKV